MSRIPGFSKTLLQWYEVHKRALPWRETRDPYAIWISEIVLQQTRVDQGMSYYLRFLKRFPDVKSLAAANEQDVLNAWQGLGYYSRARNLHHAAKTIVSEFDGRFPENFVQIKSLKGIGDYTAAAIASFAFRKVYPVIDGNVIRVLCRLFGIDSSVQSAETGKALRQIAEELIDAGEPDTYNQAIMEFGALQCTPHNPDCSVCDFAQHCVAFNTGRVSELPVKKSTGKKKDRFFDYAVLKSGQYFAIRKRASKDIWENMYDFPMVEHDVRPNDFKLDSVFGESTEHGLSPVFEKSSTWKTHILSHQKIHARFHEFEIKEWPETLPEHWEIAKMDQISRYPVPKLIEQYLNGL